MKYEELLFEISNNEKFEMINKKYEEDFFGNFQIDLLFFDKLNIEIINDRGIIEICINQHRAFIKNQVPLCFAINYLNPGDTRPLYTFDSIAEAQNFLFDSVHFLLIIIEENLLDDIVRKWLFEKTTTKHKK